MKTIQVILLIRRCRTILLAVMHHLYSPLPCTEGKELSWTGSFSKSCDLKGGASLYIKERDVNIQVFVGYTKSSFFLNVTSETAMNGEIRGFFQFAQSINVLCDRPQRPKSVKEVAHVLQLFILIMLAVTALE